MVLWLWCRPAAAALIRSLAWEPPYTIGAAQEMAERQKKKKKKVNSVNPEGLEEGSNRGGVKLW